MTKDSQVLAFRGIRYGRAERFGPAEMVAFTEEMAGAERGPICPQSPSRLEVSNGPQAPNRQDEHCQYLSVFTQSRTGNRPVMVFLHGGNFVNGGGELPWYDGTKLVEEQDVVFVSVSYRLGAFGFWLPDGSSGMSPAYSDIAAALEWVQHYITLFGGDPDNVTIASQSAGAVAARGLVDWGYGQKYFRRIIGESGLGGRIPRENIESTCRRFDEILGADPKSADPADILQAQDKLAQERKGDPGWHPVRPDSVAPFNVDMISGWNREDLSVLGLIAASKKPEPGTPLQPFRDQSEIFVNATKNLALEAAQAGRASYLYSFDWNGPDTGMGNCHCIELPFLYGDGSAWEAAPMLAGADWSDIERLGRSMRAQWASFARTGDPNIEGGPRWVTVSDGEMPVTSLP